MPGNEKILKMSCKNINRPSFDQCLDHMCPPHDISYKMYSTKWINLHFYFMDVLLFLIHTRETG